VAVTYVPAPSFILFCQLASCAAFVKGLSVAGVVECEPLEYEKSKKFALIVFGFIGTLFANVTALRVSALLHEGWEMTGETLMNSSVADYDQLSVGPVVVTMSRFGGISNMITGCN
jgi:hypothetical protein